MRLTFTISVLVLPLLLSAQLVAFVGVNENSPDGFSFVALDTFPSGTHIYFTTEEYLAGNQAFDATEEEIAYYEAPAAGIPRGHVVFIKEVDTNTFEIGCTDAGDCGTFTMAAVSGPFNLGGQDELYLYADTDDNPNNGVTEVYAVAYHNFNTEGIGFLPAANDPREDFPGAIVLDGLNNEGMAGQFEFTVGLRNGSVGTVELEDPAKYTIDTLANSPDLSTAPFTDLMSAIVLLSLSEDDLPTIAPNPVGKILQLRWKKALTERMDIWIYDSLGRPLHRASVGAGTNDSDLSVESWPAGVYYIQLLSGRRSGSLRFIKN